MATTHGSENKWLTQSEKGARAIINTFADMTGDGIVGDNTLEGNEEALRAFDIVVQLDQLRFANRLSGRLESKICCQLP